MLICGNEFPSLILAWSLGEMSYRIRKEFNPACYGHLGRVPFRRSLSRTYFHVSQPPSTGPGIKKGLAPLIQRSVTDPKRFRIASGNLHHIGGSSRSSSLETPFLGFINLSGSGGLTRALESIRSGVLVSEAGSEVLDTC